MAERLRGEFPDGLTPRQVEIVQCAADGLSVKETAAKLFIAEQTVKNHRFVIMRIAGVHDAPAMVRWAKEKGFLPV